jgi:hypothetical protein
MMTKLHDNLLNIMKKLPTDYIPWGKVERWEKDNESYPDCSSGCKHYFVLEGKLGMDWGVCTNNKSPRVGLLTFEHQAGYGCFEEDKKDA